MYLVSHVGGSDERFVAVGFETGRKTYFLALFDRIRPDWIDAEDVTFIPDGARFGNRKGDRIGTDSGINAV